MGQKLKGKCGPETYVSGPRMGKLSLLRLHCLGHRWLHRLPLRQEKINTHGVVLRALGGLGRALIEAYPTEWQGELDPLKEIDWRKSVGNKVNPEWENVCITAGSVLSNRQARVATLAVLRGKVGLDLSGQESQFKARRDAVGVA